MKDNFFCKDECLYVDDVTYVKQTEMKKMWPLTTILKKKKN